MSGRELPVLNFASFRKYPTKLSRQEFGDDREVCHGCLSGACCSNQDPIALTSFDVFRLSAFFDLSPAEFMLSFTQDAFDGEDEDRRRAWNNDPGSSVVTWLRRRENFAASPCIFLKYVRDADGTPRRICSVHDARPISCREYYYNHCKARGTGELAALLAEGFEKVRDGEITEAMADAELARFGVHDFETATLAESLEYGFWAEMKCAVNMDRANVEGANSYDMADYQDPIDEKLNRVLSAKYLRSEETYGPRPNGEQLMPYTSGRGFAGSPEYGRIMALLRTPPATGLYKLGNYPHWVGVRTMVPGVRHADVFPVIPDAEAGAFLGGVPAVQLFPRHDLGEVRAVTLRDVYASIIRAFNHLIRFSGHVAALDPVLEYDPPGTIEGELLRMIADFETSLNPYVARNPYFEPVRCHMARASFDKLERDLAAASSHEEVFNCWRQLCRVREASSTLPAELRKRVRALNHAVHARLEKDELGLYVRGDNPVEARRRSGGRLGAGGAWKAWAGLYGQALDMRFAALAGFSRVDLASYYRRAVDDLEKLPFRRSYAVYLYEAVKHLTQSMSFYSRIPYREMPFQDAADRLAAYGARLFNWMEEREEENHDCESAAEFLAAAYKGLGRSYGCDRNFGLVVYRVLDGQLPDGSWKTNPTPENAPDSQGEFLNMMFRATRACVNALRPLRGDVSDPENAVLGLI